MAETITKEQLDNRLKKLYSDGFRAGYYFAKDEKWVEVTNDPSSLPQTDECVLVSCKTKKGLSSVNMVYYADGEWHGSVMNSSVEAWQPLPQPFKPGETE